MAKCGTEKAHEKFKKWKRHLQKSGELVSRNDVPQAAQIDH